MNKIFLATPILAFNSNEELQQYKTEVRDLVSLLTAEGYEVFSEICTVSTSADYDSPADALKIDMAEIEKADAFIIHYPKPMATSALIELGMAIGFKKKILIITPERKVLPKGITNWDKLFDSVEIVEVPNLDFVNQVFKNR